MDTSIVKVYNSKYGKWEKNARVVLGFSFGMTKPVFTNSNGVAEVKHSTTGQATIYVNGKTFEKMKTPGAHTVTI